jgi:hypothetical protein
LCLHLWRPGLPLAAHQVHKLHLNAGDSRPARGGLACPRLPCSSLLLLAGRRPGRAPPTASEQRLNAAQQAAHAARLHLLLLHLLLLLATGSSSCSSGSGAAPSRHALQWDGLVAGAWIGLRWPRCRLFSHLGRKGAND